jgi:glucose/arabinose dehydrogenase
VGPDNMLFFTQGTATNSAVVGLDNYLMGWLPMHPEFHDIPCRDLTLAGNDYTTGNPLTDDSADTVTTGAYLLFGTSSEAGQVVQGKTKCSGAVLGANLDGSDLEVFADGFRNPYGLAFHPDGRLFITENGPDDRGSHPVSGPDNLYEVIQGGWYGWPDFYGGVPVNDPARKPETAPPSEPVLLNPPPLATQPTATLEAHSSSNGFDFSHNEAFAPVGQAFIAQLGDIAPVSSGGAQAHAGHQVVIVTPDGTVQPFLTSVTEHQEDETAFRPTDATFNPTGDVLYVVHFGELEAVPGGLMPTPRTGALIRIARQGQ